MSAAPSVGSQIEHYQESIQKYHGNSARILHCINRLYKLPVSVQHLQDTGVGKTINSLRKSDGEVGESARALVAKWKQMVEAESSENEQDSHKVEQTHSGYNGDSGNESHRERSDNRSKDKLSKSSRDYDSRDHSRSDDGYGLKRRRDSESELYREKRSKGEKMNISLANHNSISCSGERLNGDSEGSDEEWSVDIHNNDGANSEDENNTRRGHCKNERTSSEEKTPQFSDNEVNNSELLTPASDKESRHRKESEGNSRHDKSNKKEKSSSHKHKHKSSSSSSGKSKHSSSSRNDHKERKSSSSSKHRDEKSSSGRSTNLKLEESNVSEGSEEKSKSKEREKKDKQKDKHRSKDEKKSKDKKEKKKEETEEDGVDSNSGKSFGEALGMMFPPEKSKKKSSVGASSSQSPSKKKPKPSSSSSERKTPSHEHFNLSPEMESETSALDLEPSDIDEDFCLPTLNPNYKPLPQPNFYNSPTKRYQNDEDDLSNIMYSKVQRTKVFSGNKTGYTFVPSLFDLCTRVLQENIDALEYTGGVPFDLLKPVLERATPDQLFTLEHYNAYLIEDTDTFWEYHCKKDFRTKKREELETWREMYMRCREEREIKLKSLTANIAASSKAKAMPVRKTQLAYIESAVKPPRNIARKQAKFGTGQASTSSSSSKQDSSDLSSSFTGRSNTSAGPAVAVPAPRGSSGGSHPSSSCKPKPKAPMMQKALKLFKHNRFKR